MRWVPTVSVVVGVVLLLAVGVGGVAADATTAETAAECEPNASEDVIGCWNGVHYSESVDFNQSDGLTAAQLEELTHLNMARVEYLRERPFETDVPVETVSREEFMSDSGGEASAETQRFNRWNDQVWEALFVVGENESAAEEIDAVFGGAVSGFYSPAEDRIVLVVAENESVQVSESTLVHELTHAMQDQYHDLGRSRYVGATQDADLAVDGMIEGEAVYIEERYDERCAGNWTCLEDPDTGDSGGSQPDLNFGILQTILQPYSDGPFYVADLIEEDGWSAVNASMNDPPESTAEIIHRNSTYETTPIEFEDTAQGGWETYPDQGVDGAETAGEASMFTMFWYQSYQAAVANEETTPTFDVNVHLQTTDELRTRRAYNYDHPSTAGWAGDELYPYRNDAGDEELDGYVWVTEWQTEADAEEFHAMYLDMLEYRGAELRDDGVRTIADGGFRGAYGVERDGTRVTIAHAPGPEDVFELRPNLDLRTPDTEDGTAGDDGTDDGSEGNGSNAGDGNESEFDDSTRESAPGLGVVAAVAALLAAAALAVGRSRP